MPALWLPAGMPPSTLQGAYAGLVLDTSTGDMDPSPDGPLSGTTKGE